LLVAAIGYNILQLPALASVRRFRPAMLLGAAILPVAMFPSQRWPAVLALVCLMAPFVARSARSMLAVACMVLVAASAISAANPSISDDGEHGPDWDQVRRWVRHQTPKTAKFVTTTTGVDFGVMSLRSSVTTRAGALLWIDPLLAKEARARADRVEMARQNGVWDVGGLIDLARQWGASYVLVKGPFTNAESEPLCRFGAYSVFDARTCCGTSRDHV
jgi:hypothetical protein